MLYKGMQPSAFFCNVTATLVLSVLLKSERRGLSPRPEAARWALRPRRMPVVARWPLNLGRTRRRTLGQRSMLAVSLSCLIGPEAVKQWKPLGSDEASGMTGQTMAISNGMRMS